MCEIKEGKWSYDPQILIRCIPTRRGEGLNYGEFLVLVNTLGIWYL